MTHNTAQYYRALLKDHLRQFHPFDFFIQAEQGETVENEYLLTLYTTERIPDTLAEIITEFSKTYQLRYTIGQKHIFNILSTAYTFSK